MNWKEVTTAAVAPSLLAAVTASASTLCPVDDFEVGGFDYQSRTAYQELPVAIPGHASHAIWSDRTIVLEPNGGLVHARLFPGSAIDDFVTVTVEAAGRVRISYDWGSPADLTFGGIVDRIEMQVRGPGGSQLTCGIGDGSSVTGVNRTMSATSAIQTISWPLTTWVGGVTDITNATTLTLYFTAPPTVGDYEVYDVRFRGTGSTPVDVTGDFVATQVPPIPSSPLAFRALDLVGNPLYSLDAGIGNAETDAQTVPPLDWNWAETPGLGGEIAEMTLLWTDPTGIQETTFDFTFDVSSVNGWTPDLYPPDPIHGPENILLAFPIVLRDATGAVQGVSETRVSFDFSDLQGGSLEFQEVTVTENPATRSWTDGFTLSFRMQFSGSGSPDYVFPVFTATWLSDWSTQVPTGVSIPSGTEPADALRLTAVPSVSRTGTELRASRPFEDASRVLIHDVTGRRVRTLPVPPGAQVVRWDGRGAAGLPLPAGVYFASLHSSQERRAARITLLK